MQMESKIEMWQHQQGVKKLKDIFLKLKVKIKFSSTMPQRSLIIFFCFLKKMTLYNCCYEKKIKEYTASKHGEKSTVEV